MIAIHSIHARVCQSSKRSWITSHALIATRRCQRGCGASRSGYDGPKPIGVCRASEKTAFTSSYSSIIFRKASASPRENLANSSQVRSRSRHIVSHVPSGNGMCTTGSGWMYSRPYRSSWSSRSAGFAWIRLCAVEQVSCRKPGSVSSSVAVSPPSTCRASSTHSRCPAFARYAAAISALCPPPATTTSYGSGKTREPLVVAAEDRRLLVRGQPERAHDLGRPRVAHVERVVGAEQHAFRAGEVEQRAQDAAVEDDRVEVEPPDGG